MYAKKRPVCFALFYCRIFLFRNFEGEHSRVALENRKGLANLAAHSGLGQEVGELLVGRLAEVSLAPQVGCQVAVGLAHGIKGSLEEVTHGLGVTGGLGVHILQTSVGQQLLGHLSGHNTGTAGCRHQAHSDGTALAGHLHKRHK